MEWIITKLAVIILSIMLFIMLITFCGEFNKVLKLDKIIQNQKDVRMYRDMEEAIPGIASVVVSRINLEVKNGV